MKEIVARNQVDLGSARCMQLAFSGMVFRLFRSMITVAILGMAVAFLAHMLAYTVMSGETSRRIWRELESERRLGTELRRLESPDAVAILLTHWQRAAPARLAEHRVWAGLDDETAETLKAHAAAVRSFQRQIDGLYPRERAILVGDRNALALLENLADPSARAAFLVRLDQMDRPVPMGGEAELARLAERDWPELERHLSAIREGHRRAIHHVETALEGQSLAEALIASPERVKQRAAAAGFSVGELDFERLAAFARDARIQRQTEETLASQVIRRNLSRELNVPLVQVHSQRLLNWLAADVRNAEAFDVLLEASPLFEPLGAADLQRVAARALELRRLQRLVPEEPDLAAAENLFGLDNSARWLILLAFLVCVIGVANAMLMSVTERFTEIATMKCLGAMDKFIMLMFVFEAGIQGLLGGVMGAAAGLLLAWIRGFSEFGGTLVVWPVMGTVLLSALTALGVGILLAVLAAVGPSLVAARLAPMEAMRVD